MKSVLFAAAASSLVVAGCSGADATTQDAVAQPATTAPTAAPDAPGAFGMTEAQILDADLIGADGLELGDVEAVVRAVDGSISHLVVEIDDTAPDRYVQLPAEGLEAARTGNDWDVRTTISRDELMALPEVRR